MITTLTFVVALFASVVHSVDPLVHLSYATYQGTALLNGVTQWLGLRYAAPPLGDLRFRAPTDPPKADGVQLASEHGSICLGTGQPFPTTGSDEDCLFLDIYAPSDANTSSRLPVYFFIQGGGFNTNSNANYNGSGIVIASDMNLVVVNFNYRVGPYGFLASKEVQQDGNLNVGILDQFKALEWVQEHVSQFGGNPEHVVLGGDSAGASSITLLLTAYGGKNTGLFHGAIGESQNLPMQLSVANSQYQYTALIQRVGCQNASDTLSCLRSTDVETLQSNNVAIPYPGHSTAPLFMYGPVLDGTLNQDFTYKLFGEGKFVKVPTVFGDVTNEGTIFAPTTTSTSQELIQFISDQYASTSTETLNEISKLYPESTQFADHGAFFSAAANAYGEITFVCAGLFMNSNIDRLVAGKSWNYHYNVMDPTLEAEGEGVPHVSELGAVWGPENINGGAPASLFTTNAAIIPVVQGYWTSFVRALDPNVYRAPNTPTWEPFTTPTQTRILLQTNSTEMETVPQDQRDRCNFITSVAVGQFMQ